MSEEQGLPIEDALKLLAYLTTCAELCTYEPWHYGQLRLIDAAGRLSRALVEAGADAQHPWLADVQRAIETRKELVMFDFPGFQAFLRETPGTVAAELRKEGW